jgi:predicted nucleic-acid-binding Zn-ribbon protein
MRKFLLESCIKCRGRGAAENETRLEEKKDGEIVRFKSKVFINH